MQPIAATTATRAPAQVFRWRMLRNGSYSAWFRTQQGEGTGIVVLSDGKLTGGDNVSAYRGTYVMEGDTFRASFAALTLTGRSPRVNRRWNGTPRIASSANVTLMAPL